MANCEPLLEALNLTNSIQDAAPGLLQAERLFIWYTYVFVRLQQENYICLSFYIRLIKAYISPINGRIKIEKVLESICNIK